MIFIPIIILIYLVSIAASDKSPKIKKTLETSLLLQTFPLEVIHRSKETWCLVLKKVNMSTSILI